MMEPFNAFLSSLVPGTPGVCGLCLLIALLTVLFWTWCKRLWRKDDDLQRRTRTYQSQQEKQRLQLQTYRHDRQRHHQGQPLRRQQQPHHHKQQPPQVGQNRSRFGQGTPHLGEQNQIAALSASGLEQIQRLQQLGPSTKSSSYGREERMRRQQLVHERLLCQRPELRNNPPEGFKNGLCVNCQIFFLGPPPSLQGFTKHSERWSTVRRNAKYGCHVCAMFCRQTQECSIKLDKRVEFRTSGRAANGTWQLTCELGQDPWVDILMIPYNSQLMSPRAWGSQHQHREEILSRSNRSIISRDLAQSWHSTCKGKHNQCCSRSSPNNHSWRPSRLLTFTDLDAAGNDIVHLAKGSALPPKVEYVALSHCWGKLEIKKLLSSTEIELHEGISISQLPRTFRQAITVSRWLGYNHIWIDSLCIMQDSVEDWRTESQTMKSVYANAAITIVAAHAKDASHGLFVERDTQGIIPAVVPCNWGGFSFPEYYCVADMRLGRFDVDFSDLAKRAWTVQERVLSPRQLIFGRTQMFYECLEGSYCESWPLTGALDHSGSKMNQLGDTKIPLQQRWRRIVESYSRASLTKQDDKIIALAGIAEAMQGGLKDEYVVGMWRRNMPTELWWSGDARTPPGPGLRPDPCIAPTWSWLSTSSTAYPSQWTWPDVRKELITVTEIDLDLVGPNYPTGHVNPGARLRVRGRLKAARWNLRHLLSRQDVRAHYFKVTWDGSDSFHNVNLDFFTGIEQACDDIVFLPIASFRTVSNKFIPSPKDLANLRANEAQNDHPSVEGLVLTPVDIQAETYARVGHFGVLCGINSSYLFLERRNPAQPTWAVETQDGPVEVVPDGNEHWISVPEKDIIIV